MLWPVVPGGETPRVVQKLVTLVEANFWAQKPPDIDIFNVSGGFFFAIIIEFCYWQF